MKRVVYAVALAIVGVGCAVKAQLGPPSNERPLVTLTNNDIAVQPAELVFERRGSVVIRWQLPDGASYEFPNNGIVIAREVASASDLRPGGKGDKQDEVVRCERVANGRAFQCQNNNSRPGTYKYTVNLVDRGRPVSKDPVIVNR
ncbi:MAG TPA: hypothetical protein VMK32_05025 [Burkholderiaceae bacterium]|nr:hypothetical protein [Burkholderiaceae bacterium]